MDAGPGQAQGQGHVQVGRRGDDRRIMPVRQCGVQVGIMAIHLVLPGDPQSQRLVGLANRRSDASRGLEAAQVAEPDRAHADNEQAFA